MSHDDKLQQAIDQYILRRVQEGVDRYEASLPARASYKDARFIHVHHSERTVEMRRLELQELFEHVDAKGQFPKGQTGVLEETTDSLQTVTVHKRPETVTRTEVVPMLPCKGYGLPRKTLFIGGRGDYVAVSRPMQEDQLEVLLEKTRPVEEQFVEYLKKEQLREQQGEEQTEKDITSRIQTAKKSRKSERESEAKEGEGVGPPLPNCTVV